MDGPPFTVCRHCAARVEDEAQATCPHCLEPLSMHTLGSKASLEGFREDRRAHGAPVPDLERGSRRPGLALAFAFTAAIMFLAGIGISFSGLTSGSWAQATRSLGEAAIPLAIGVGMVVVARKYGGSGR